MPHSWRPAARRPTTPGMWCKCQRKLWWQSLFPQWGMWKGNDAIVLALLSEHHGPDPNATNATSWMPLRIACERGHKVTRIQRDWMRALRVPVPLSWVKSCPVHPWSNCFCPHDSPHDSLEWCRYCTSHALTYAPCKCNVRYLFTAIWRFGFVYLHVALVHHKIWIVYTSVHPGTQRSILQKISQSCTLHFHPKS